MFVLVQQYAGDYRGRPLRNLLAFLAALMLCHAAYSAELFGTVDALSGSADVVDQSGKSTAASVGLKIFEGQTINSAADGEVHLVTEDGGIIAVRPNTVFRVDEYKAEGNTSTDKIFMSLLKGTIRSITGWVGKYNNPAYRITTPTATIGIRGTDHETTVIDKGDGDEPGTYDNVNEGATVMKTPHGTAEVTPGKFAFAPRSRAVAPFFLAQRPHFLAVRRLKIEERIPQRKEFLRGRLEQMREERIKNPRLIQGNRLNQVDERRVNASGQERGQVIGNRNELREQRLEQSGLRQQERNKEIGSSRENNLGEIKARAQRRKEFMKKNGESGEAKRRNPERKRRVKMRRE